MIRSVYIFSIFRQFSALLSLKAFFKLKLYINLRRLIKNSAIFDNFNDFASSSKTVIFVSNAWNGSNVPFYQFYLAKSALSKFGNVRILHDSFGLFPSLYNIIYRCVFDNGIKLSVPSSDLTFAERRQVLRVIKSNIIWQSRSEIFVSLVPRALIVLLYRRQKRHYRAVLEKLTRIQDSVGVVIVPGGVLAVSASYVLACRKLGITFFSYDSGVDGEVIFCRNGVAAHLDDIDLSVVDSLSASARESLVSEADMLLLSRKLGEDRFKFQKIPSGFSREDLLNLRGSGFKILVPLSCPWDAASLLRSDLFYSELSFLVFISKLFPHATLIVRVHPIERHSFARRNDDLRSFVEKFDNMILVEAHDHVNTYDLLNTVDLVVCRNTSVGVEANLLGVPVISTTASYWNPVKSLVPVAAANPSTKILYLAAQKYNWLFPKCNLSNIFEVGFDEPFAFFAELIYAEQTVTKMRMARELD